MANCCDRPPEIDQNICPVNGAKGSKVPMLTLKSLLKPAALEKLEIDKPYFFCGSANCPVVYFNEDGSLFKIENLKVPVSAKSKSGKDPICYCFDWSRDRICQAIQQTGKASIVEESITAHIQAKRCGCEVNNPQGQCCLRNIRTMVEQIWSEFPDRDSGY